MRDKPARGRGASALVGALVGDGPAGGGPAPRYPDDTRTRLEAALDNLQVCIDALGPNYGTCATCDTWARRETESFTPEPYGDCSRDGFKLVPSEAPKAAIVTREGFGCRLWRPRAGEPS